MEEEKGEEEMVVEEEKEGEGEGEKVTPESEGGGEAVGESGEKEEAGEKEEVDVKKEEEHGRVEDMQTEATEPANEQGNIFLFAILNIPLDYSLCHSVSRPAS